jgi:DNA-binding beta-propeller fold protein YncE
MQSREIRATALWIALAAGCGSSSDPAPPRDPVEPELAAPRIEVVMNDAQTRSPFDATPSPNGEDVYYTALAGDESAPGVFAVAANGGEIRTLAMGDPLTAPVNISVSLDGSRLYIADPAASTVFTLPTAGGEPTPLAGTEGYAPRGLVVAQLADEREYLYFTGHAPESQEAGLFRVATRGGDVESVAQGVPFGDPAGVSVAADGAAYVVDTGVDRASARVIRVASGQASVFIDGIGVGFPAGITLTRDDKTVLVSGLDPATRRDVVYNVDTRSKKIARMTDTIGRFQEPAGLHRAHDADVFAWADSRAEDTGAVFLISLNP